MAKFNGIVPKITEHHKCRVAVLKLLQCGSSESLLVQVLWEAKYQIGRQVSTVFIVNGLDCVEFGKTGQGKWENSIDPLNLCNLFLQNRCQLSHPGCRWHMCKMQWMIERYGLRQQQTRAQRGQFKVVVFITYHAGIWFCFSLMWQGLLCNQENIAKEVITATIGQNLVVLLRFIHCSMSAEVGSDTIGCRMTTRCHLPSRPIIYQFGSLPALPPILTGAASFGCAWQVWYTPSYP